MSALDKTPIIHSDVLERLTESRLSEAKALCAAQCYAGCIYLGGYVVECCLKLAICRTLDCDSLPGTFASHALDELLLHSGLERRMKREAPGVYQSFRNIQGVWTMGKRDAVRYSDPARFGEKDARVFLGWVGDEEGGVVPWLRKQA